MYYLYSLVSGGLILASLVRVNVVKRSPGNVSGSLRGTSIYW